MLTVAQAFQQQPGCGCCWFGPGTRRTWDRPTVTPRRNSSRFPAVGGGDAAKALVAGGVRGVDEGAQRAGGLPGPDGVRVGLGGVLQVPEQVWVHS